MTALHALPTSAPDWVLMARVGADAPLVALAPGQTVRGARELREVEFSTELPGRWRLEIDDEAIEPVGAAEMRWTWKPGFFAGEVVVRLVEERSAREAEFRVDVSPDPNKFGRDVFGQMLKTLWVEAPELLIGEEPGRRRHGHESALEDPLLAYGRLRRWGPQFVRALAGVAARPITRLRHDRRRVPIHLVRRSDRRTALDLAHTGLLHADGEGVFAARTLELVDTPVVDPTTDNPANRTMLALLQSVLQRVRTCTAALAARAASEQDSETRTNLRRRWPVRERFLRQLELRLRRIRLSAPFSDLPRAEVSPAGLTAVSSNPIYARAHRMGWLCSRRGFAGDGDEDELWLPPTWEVYERWCWVAMRQRLEADGFVETSGGLEEIPLCDATWSGVHDDGRRATLLFQPKFSSWSVASHRGARSLSGELRPDIVLLVDDGEKRSFRVYDAKYRSSRSSILDAMRSAHIYHDALRFQRQRPDSSLLLAPAGGGAAWLQERSFQDVNRTGVVVLAPGESNLRARVAASFP